MVPPEGIEPLPAGRQAHRILSFCGAPTTICTWISGLGVRRSIYLSYGGTMFETDSFAPLSYKGMRETGILVGRCGFLYNEVRLRFKPA